MGEYFQPAQSEDEELFNSLMQGYNMGRYNFTQWEAEFIDSIESQIISGKKLTDKQKACIERIMSK